MTGKRRDALEWFRDHDGNDWRAVWGRSPPTPQMCAKMLNDQQITKIDVGHQLVKIVLTKEGAKALQ